MNNRAMTSPPPMTVDALNAFLAEAFPHARPPEVLFADGQRAICRMPFDQTSLRPGNTVSGPTLMALADTAAYVLVMSAVGFQPMAVTSSLTMNFLRMAGPNAVTAEARMLKRGQSLVYCDVLITAEGADNPCAHASVIYALPRSTS